jgi:glycosyltransferase involved in cell wall biosynthesis
MRIGINTLFLIPNKHGGTEHYVRNLLANWAALDDQNRYFVFANRENAGTFGLNHPNFSEVRCPVSAKNKIVRVLWEQLVLPFYVRSYNLDVLFSPAYVSPVMTYCPCKYVVAIHDLMYRHFPQNYPKAQLLYFRLLLPLSAKSVAKIITVSESNKTDIVRSLSVLENKVSVIYTAGLPDNGDYQLNDEQCKNRFRNKYGLHEPFILCVASFNPQKNIERLIQAFYLVRKSYELQLQLVLVGMKLKHGSKLIDAISGLGLQNDVKITGYVPDEDLPYFYALAELYVLPSFFEGLGVTPWEAMSCCCPVATSDIPALREVVGDAAATFNPYNVEEIAQTIYKVLTGARLRKELVEKGSERVKQFSWGKTAINTLRVFEKATCV